MNRHGLALIYADQGKWEQANELFKESMETEDNLIFATMWLNNAIAQSDAQTGIALLHEWSANNPTHLSSRIAELQYWSTEVTTLTTELNPESAESGEGAEVKETAQVEPTEEDNVAKADKEASLVRQRHLLKPQRHPCWAGLNLQTEQPSYTLVREGRKALAYAYLGEFEKPQPYWTPQKDMFQQIRL